MTARVIPRRVPTDRYLPIRTDDKQLDRLQDSLGRVLNKLLASPLAPGNFEFRNVDLVLGLNRVPHGLGRAADGFWNVRAPGTAAFLHSRQDENPFPERSFWIELTTSPTASIRLLLLTLVED